MNVNESCHTYDLSHVIYMNESRQTHEWAMSIVWTSHFKLNPKHMNEPSQLYEQVISNAW